MLNPIRARLTRADVQLTKWSRTLSRPISIPNRRTPDAADGPGTPVRRAGCIAPASNGSSDSGCAKTALTLAPCVPPDWSGFTIRYRHRGTPYEIIVDRQPDTGSVPQFTIDGEAQPAGRATVDLSDDGAPHTVHVTWIDCRSSGGFSCHTE